MSWKNYFYFTKKEKIGLTVFFAIIVCVLVFKFIVSYQKGPVSPDVIALSGDTIAPAIEKQPFGKDYPDNTARPSFQSENKKPDTTKKLPPQLFYFDPNTVDSLAFVRLGLRPYIARNILKYRSKGGRFRRPDDFARIYGISEEEFSRLRPYIQIENASNALPAAGAGKKDTIIQAKRDSLREAVPSSFVKQEKYPLGVQVDVNVADTTELRKIPNIGPSFARRIVRYRELLGGYCRAEQLLEVYGMDRVLYEKILPWVSVENPSPVLLPVNSLSLPALKKHPYINFYQAKAIVELRRKKRLSDVSDLQLLEEFSAEDITRLRPYLSFE